MRWGILALCIVALTVVFITSVSALDIDARVEPIAPTIDDEVTISVTIEDSNNVSRVELNLTYNTTVYGPYEMILDGGEYVNVSGPFPEGLVNVTISIDYNGSGQQEYHTVNFEFRVVAPDPPTFRYWVEPEFPRVGEKVTIHYEADDHRGYPATVYSFSFDPSPNSTSHAVNQTTWERYLSVPYGFPAGEVRYFINVTWNVSGEVVTASRNGTILVTEPEVPLLIPAIDPVYPTNDEIVTVSLNIDGIRGVSDVRLRLNQTENDAMSWNMTLDNGTWLQDVGDLDAGDVHIRFTVRYDNGSGMASHIHYFDFRVFDADEREDDKEGQIPIDVILLMLLMSLVIFVGFMGTYIFDRFSIPEVLSLILLGILIGAGLHLLSDDLMGLLKDVSPLVAAIALLIILFDGGINLSLDSVIKESSHASLLAILGFVITMFAIGAVAALLFFDMKILPSLMLGAALGGTSGAIVIPTVMNMDTDEDVKVLLSLESTVTDVLCIVAAVAIAEVLVPTTGSAGAAGAAQSIIGAFAVGIFMGGIGGVVWLRFMPTIERMRFGFMLTIAFVFTLYALTQFAGGSGPVAALSVGLVLANGPEIGRMFRYKETTSISRSMKQFQSEITFFVKSFFFVYVGLLFTFAGPEIYLYGALLAGIILFVRMATVKLVMKDMRIQDRELMTILGPRGLSAAVLATLPITYGFEEKGILTASQIEIFTNVSLIVIIATVIVTTIGIPAGKKRWTAEHMGEISSARKAKREKRVNNKKEKRIEKETRRIEASKEKGGADDLILLEEEMHSRSKAADHERKETVKALEDEIAGRIRALKEHYGARGKELEDGEESKRKELEDELAQKERSLDEELRENKRRIGEEQQSAIEAYEKDLEERKKALEEDFTGKKEALRSEKEERRESLKVQAALGTALEEEGPKKRTKVKTVPKKKAAAKKGTAKKVMKKKMVKKE